MVNALTPWKALLFSALACGGNSNIFPDASQPHLTGDYAQCLDSLACVPESFQERCGNFSLYGLFSTNEALEKCVDKYELSFWYGPFGDLGCLQSNPKGLVEIPITPCGKNEPEPFAGMNVNTIISYERSSEDQLDFYCEVPCVEKLTRSIPTAVPSLLPEEQTVLLRMGMYAQEFELLLAIYPSERDPEPCFKIGYCVIPRENF